MALRSMLEPPRGGYMVVRHFSASGGWSSYVAVAKCAHCRTVYLTKPTSRFSDAEYELRKLDKCEHCGKAIVVCWKRS